MTILVKCLQISFLFILFFHIDLKAYSRCYSFLLGLAVPD